jgi:hypothetical protein
MLGLGDHRWNVTHSEASFHQPQAFWTAVTAVRSSSCRLRRNLSKRGSGVPGQGLSGISSRSSRSDAMASQILRTQSHADPFHRARRKLPTESQVRSGTLQASLPLARPKIECTAAVNVVSMEERAGVRAARRVGASRYRDIGRPGKERIPRFPAAASRAAACQHRATTRADRGGSAALIVRSTMLS